MNTVGIVAAWLFSLHRPLLNGDFAVLYLLLAVPNCRRWLAVTLALALAAVEWYVLFCQEFYYFNVWSLASLGVSEDAPLLLMLLAAFCALLYVGAAVWIASTRSSRKRSVAIGLASVVILAVLVEKGMNAFAATSPVDLVRFPSWSLLRSLTDDAVDRKLHLERIAFSQDASFTPLAHPSVVYAELQGLAAGGHEAILVVVEALGFEQGDAWRQFLVDAVTGGDLSRRVRFGSDASIGFTVHGEFRILCNALMVGIQVDPARLPGDCIPRIYESKGLMTRSFHGYSGAFYQRTSWYPHLGFKDAKWADSVQGVPCRFVFVHACDEDLIKYFLDLEPPSRPGLDYLLTLDAHLPFLPAVRDYISAIGGDHAASHYQLYRALTRNTLNKVGEIIRRRPTATVVITGDHAPYMLLGRPDTEKLARDRVSYLVVYPEGR